MAVRGIDSLRSPLRGSPFAVRPVCPTGCAATQPIPGPRPFGARASSVQKRSRRFCVEPRSGVLIPLGLGDAYKQKARTSVQALNLNMAVRGDSNPRYVAVYTLSRRAPSATRTPHHIVLLPDRLGGQRGATIGSCAKTVKQNLHIHCRLLMQ